MKSIVEKVLDFYSRLQFNETRNPSVLAEMIKKYNSVEYIYPDSYSIIGLDKIIELGCGVGWLANSLAYYYDCYVEAVDFNSRAIEIAKETAEILGVSDKVCFIPCDLFSYEGSKADLVISCGVLHHTEDCMMGIKKCISCVKPGGTVFIGLYHKFGRKAFLDYFTKLKEEGLTFEELFTEYRRLDSRTEDDKQALSWFMDQVMHPYETQHTLKEVIAVFEECGVVLESTSINGYDSYYTYDELFAKETLLYEIGQQCLKEGKFYPGFFYCKGKTKQKK